MKFILCALLTLSGCLGPRLAVPRPPVFPTAAGYMEAMNTWLGADAHALIRQLGSPAKTFTLPDGSQRWTYYDIRTRSTPLTAETSTVLNHCTTEFEVSPSGRIVDCRWVGNICKAVPSRQPTDCTGGVSSGRVRSVEEPSDSPGFYKVEVSRGRSFLVAKTSHPPVEIWVIAHERLGICGASGVGPYLRTEGGRVFPIRSCGC